MLEVRYQTDTGQTVIDHMPTKNPEKTAKKIRGYMNKEFIHRGAVSIETAGVVGINVILHEVH